MADTVNHFKHRLNVHVTVVFTLQDGKRWRCQTQGCRATVSLRKDSFLQQSHLSLRDAILVRYFV